MSNPIIPSSNAAPVVAPVTQSQTAPAVPETGAVTPTAAEVRKMKIKFDGQESEMTEAEVIALAQQGKSSQKRFQEAAQTKKEAQELTTYLKENPREALKKLGIDVRQFSEEYLMEMITEQSMSPEQKSQREMESKLRAYEKADKDAKDKKDKEEHAALDAKYTQEFEQTFITALSESGLPKTAFTLRRMADLQMMSYKKGLELSPSQIAKIVREDYVNEQKALFGSVDGAQLMEMLGQDIVKKLSKHQVAEHKKKITYSTPVAPKREQSKKNSSPENNAFEALRKKNRQFK